jgi:hypothetical protein
MKRLGYFVTESSEHNSEYCPYFIPHGPDSVARFDVPIDEYLRRCDGVVEEFERLKIFTKSDKPIEVHRSHEYGSLIIHSVATGTPRVIYGNMPNRGAIANLPPTAIAEAPTLVDRNGLQFTTVGELPPQLIGYMQPHVTQHELFIRAALEGRRDHVYQAAMFDPLTAATLPLDKIVEMCDELIAAHGNSLPKLDSKKTLVPTSGKSFGAVDPRTLRASWDAAQKKQYEHAITDWHVLGPIKHDKAREGLEVSSPFEDEFLRRGDGAVDLKAAYKSETSTLKWVPAKADRRGFVDLGIAVGAIEFVNAYAYTEIESIHAREAVLSIGSDDGVQVWLNGKMVHKNETGRGFTPGSDKVAVYLKAGVNRLVLKIDNYVGGWGFGVMVPPANF